MVIDTNNMCSHLQRKLFDDDGIYHHLWLAIQDDPEMPARTHRRTEGGTQLHRQAIQYHEVLMQLKKKQKNTQLWSRLPIFFTMGGGAITGAAKLMEADQNVVVFSLVLTVIGFIIMVYGIIRSLADKSIEKTEEENKLFMNRYICPNPECGAFKGNTDFEALRKMKRCPNCGCNYTVKQG